MYEHSSYRKKIIFCDIYGRSSRLNPSAGDLMRGCAHVWIFAYVALMSLAANSYLHAGTDGKGQARVADGADVLLAEEVVELSEDSNVAGGGVDDVEV